MSKDNRILWHILNNLNYMSVLYKQHFMQHFIVKLYRIAFFADYDMQFANELQKLLFKLN